MRKVIVLLILLILHVPCFGEDYSVDENGDYSVVLDEKGKHGLITFLVTIDKKGVIKEVAILKNREIRGGKINRKRFLGQFRGKSSNDAIKLKRDIHSVTGATISSNAATKAARRALMMWEELILKEEQ